MKTAIYTHDEILKSKAVVKIYGSESKRTFPSPAKYLKGLQGFATDNEALTLKLDASHLELSENKDGTQNKVFKRFNLHYNFSIDEELQYNIGLVVALDKGKPIAKVYSGVQVVACLNMCIFGADQKYTFDLNNDPESYRKFFEKEIKDAAIKAEKGKRIITELKKIHLTNERILLLNGALLERLYADSLKMGLQPIIQGIKLQTAKDGKYNAKNGLSAWEYYNSLTEYFNPNVHILDIPEKSLELFTTLKDVLQMDLHPEKRDLLIDNKTPILEIG